MVGSFFILDSTPKITLLTVEYERAPNASAISFSVNPSERRATNMVAAQGQFERPRRLDERSVGAQFKPLRFLQSRFRSKEHYFPGSQEFQGD